MVGVHSRTKELTPPRAAHRSGSARRAAQGARRPVRQGRLDAAAARPARRRRRARAARRPRRAQEFGRGAFRDAVRGAAERAAGARREGRGAVPRRREGRVAAARLERAPRGARPARRVLPLRPAEDAEEGAAPPPRSSAWCCRSAPSRRCSRRSREARATADGTDLAKTLGNLPPNICTPTYLADEAKKLARQFKLGIEVLERGDMQKLGMGALLAVTQRLAPAAEADRAALQRARRRR